MLFICSINVSGTNTFLRVSVAESAAQANAAYFQ